MEAGIERATATIKEIFNRAKENALLSNFAKDSETLNENVLDSLIEKADSEGKAGEKSLEVSRGSRCRAAAG